MGSRSRRSIWPQEPGLNPGNPIQSCNPQGESILNSQTNPGEATLAIEALVFDAYGTLFDTQSVIVAIQKVFPAQADYITHVWRQKQLEYSWLRAAMGHYADFAAVTRDALVYALATVAAEIDTTVVADLCQAYERLTPFPDTGDALTELAPFRLAVLSNGSPAMLKALLDHSGLARHFEQVISTDLRHTFKPHPEVYHAAANMLGLTTDKILLVSSNGFDIAGAKQCGLKTLRIERLPIDALRKGLADPAKASSQMFFSALRSQLETFGEPTDFTCSSLRDVAALAPSIASARS
jgi:2-haloacid dehalogenase